MSSTQIKPTNPHNRRSASPFPPLHNEKSRAHATKRTQNDESPTKKSRFAVYFLPTPISIAERYRNVQKKCLPSRDRTAGLKITIGRCMQLQSCALPAELRRVGKRVVACWCKEYWSVVYKAPFRDGHKSVLSFQALELVPWLNLAWLKGLRRRRVRTARVDGFKQIWARSNVLSASFDG
jgi:hypothetical protein